MRNIIAVILLVLAGGAVAYGFGFGFSSLVYGTVIPAPVPAQVTCYPAGDGFRLAAANVTRPDVLAVFVRPDAQGRDADVCFLRPVGAGGAEWAQLDRPLSVPSYDTTDHNWNGTGMTELEWRQRYPTGR